MIYKNDIAILIFMHIVDILHKVKISRTDWVTR